MPFHEDESVLSLVVGLEPLAFGDVWEVVEPPRKKLCQDPELPVTPTEPEDTPHLTEAEDTLSIPPTIIDSPSAFSDNLCGWFDDEASQHSADSASSFDTDCTENEDCFLGSGHDSSRVKDKVVAPVHHLRSQSFWDSVYKEIEFYATAEWFSMADFITQLTTDFEQNIEIMSSGIRNLVPPGTEFKIGITCDPKYRWFQIGGGEYARNYAPQLILGYQ
jgi:hypothetical protein